MDAYLNPTADSYYDPYGNMTATTADTYANSFNGMYNQSFGNPGWGMDPNYMTPSYAGIYRPAYNGPQPYQMYGNPSFFGAVGSTISGGSRPYWGNPIDNQEPYNYLMATKPFDAMAWGVQNIGLPAASFYLGAKLMPGSFSQQLLGNNVIGNTARGFARGVGTGFAAGLGRATAIGTAAKTFRSIYAQGTFGNAYTAAMAGKSWYHAPMALAGAASTSLPLAMRGIHASAGAAGKFATGLAMARSVGGFAARAYAGGVLPWQMIDSATDTLDEGLIQPYMNTRSSARSLQQNFADVTFSPNEGVGSTIHGGGLSAAAASRMAGQITRQGMQDYMFSAEEYSGIADMGSRAGLLDTIKAKQIPGRVKDIAEQIKLIVNISKDPSIQNAIEELSKLNMAGASLTGGKASAAGSAYTQLGFSASQAGISVQRMMQTVGQQGQMLYSMNGMTPYMGMMAAANSYAGFSSARRAGIINEETFARLGGVEGATQSSLTGQIAVARTPYAQMAMYNSVMGVAGGVGRGMSPTQVASTFGGYAAQNPVMAQGRMMLYGGQMATMFNQNSEHVENLATSLLKNANQKPMGADGKYAPEQLAVVLQSMGMSGDQIQAFMLQRHGETNDEARAQRLIATNRSRTENYQQYLDQEGLGPSLFSRVKHKFREGYKDVTSYLSEYGIGAAEFVGESQDTLNKFVNSLVFGSTEHKESMNRLGSIMGLSGMKEANPDRDTFHMAKTTGIGSLAFFGSLNKEERIANHLNDAVKNKSHPGHEAAVEYYNSKGPDRTRALSRFLKQAEPAMSKRDISVISGGTGSLQDVYTNKDTLNSVSSAISNMEQEWNVSARDSGNFQSHVEKVALGSAQQNAPYSNIDLLKFIGTHQQFLREASGKDLGEVQQLIQGNKEYSRLYSGREDKAVDIARQVATRAMNTGGLDISRVADVAASQINVSVDDLISGKGPGIDSLKGMSPEIKARLQQAIKAKDKSETSKLLEMYATQISGVMDASGNLSPYESGKAVSASQANSQVAEQLRQVHEANQSALRTTLKDKSASVDYGSFASSMMKFDEAVKSFAMAVSKMPNGNGVSFSLGFGSNTTNAGQTR